MAGESLPFLSNTSFEHLLMFSRSLLNDGAGADFDFDNYEPGPFVTSSEPDLDARDTWDGVDSDRNADMSS